MKTRILVHPTRRSAFPGDADAGPAAPRHPGRPKETILGCLAAMLSGAFASRVARREAYLAASADMKDYEYRLKAWDDEEERDQRFRQALWP